MARFASLLFPALAFVSDVAAGETDSGVRKQVRIVPSGRIAPSDETLMKQASQSSNQAGSHEDAVRRQIRKNEGKHELDWSDASGKVDVVFDAQIYDVDGVLYRRAGGWSCEASSGAELIDTNDSARVNVTESQCLRVCNQDQSCSCTRYSRYYSNKCWKMKNCPSEGHRLAECDRTDRFDTYIRADAVSVSLAPTPAPPYDKFGTDVYCFEAGSSVASRLTHDHGQTPSGVFASQAACEALCDSAPECRFYQWRHDETAMSKWTCSTFYSCDRTEPYKDGDGGHVWRKTAAPTPLTPDQNGFVDVGMGWCSVGCSAGKDHGSGRPCRDPSFNVKQGEAANCAANCGGNNHGCFGYSTNTAGDCYLWKEKDLSFGGSYILNFTGWEHTHCKVKACVLDDSCAVCTDAPGWTNGHGFGCHSYAVHFCAGGAVKPANLNWAGDGMKNPELNCCACGGGVFQ